MKTEREQGVWRAGCAAAGEGVAEKKVKFEQRPRDRGSGHGGVCGEGSL